MEGEEIIVLDEGEDSPVGPAGYCCFLIFAPFRG